MFRVEENYFSLQFMSKSKFEWIQWVACVEKEYEKKSTQRDRDRWSNRERIKKIRLIFIIVYSIQNQKVSNDSHAIRCRMHVFHIHVCFSFGFFSPHFIPLNGTKDARCARQQRISHQLHLIESQWIAVGAISLCICDEHWEGIDQDSLVRSGKKMKRVSLVMQFFFFFPRWLPFLQ